MEFLKAYDIEAYSRPSLTVDLVVASKKQDGTLDVVLIKRGDHPFMNSWALPGGFVRPGESAEQAGVRELREESGIETAGLRQLGLFSAPGRDPRGWIVSCAFLATADGAAEPKFGDDALDARRFTLSAKRKDSQLQLVLAAGELTLDATLSIEDSVEGRRYAIVQSNGIAFDHARILALAAHQLGVEETARS